MDRPWLKFYDSSVPPRLEYPEIPLFQFLTDSARRFPENCALLYYGKRMIYRELEGQTNRFAQALMKLGVRKGDRVAIMLPNLPQCVIAYYGALKIGAIAVMTNPLYVERELQIQLSDSGAETMIALDLFYPRIGKIRKETGLKNIILTSVRDYLPWHLKLLYPIKARKEGQSIRVPTVPPVYDMAQLIKESPEAPPAVEVDSNDIALLQYTGGTTGTPKGAILTHRNLVANTLQCRSWMPELPEGEQVFLAVVPFFHVYGMTGCMNLSIYSGSALVLLPRFATKEVLRAVEKRRVTLFMGVQPMYVAINNHPKSGRYDLSSIRVCISGAGSLDSEVQRRFESLTGGKLIEGYGLSEASPVTHINPIHGKRKKGSIGLPLPDTLVKMVDIETGRSLPPGEVGELVIKGPQVMRGYWGKPSESAEALSDGWLRTGDLATMDEEGFFFIVNRKKEMIKTRGENVYPREVEEIISRHPQVREAVIIGLPDPFAGEIIKAYLVLKEGAAVSAEEILSFCRKDLAKFKVPSIIEFRRELPKSILGKVMRRVLLEEESAKGKETGPGRPGG